MRGAFLNCGAALLVVSALWFAAQPARAQASVAVVEAVQMPAWLERGGVRSALPLGAALRDGDAAVSGAGARVLLRLADGSAVRLGENGRLVVTGLSLSRGDRLRGALEVAAGAFRFTTAQLVRWRGERDLSIRLTTVTAGIRGTDLWGRGFEDREIVCLIEGRITVSRDGEPTVAMSDPLSFYVAPRGRPALPVAPVDPGQLAQWAAETEIAPGLGAVRRGGRFRVVAASPDNQAEALRSYDALRDAGYAAEIRPVRNEAGALIYEVRIAGLPTRADAQALAKRLAGVAGIDVVPAVR